MAVYLGDTQVGPITIIKEPLADEFIRNALDLVYVNLFGGITFVDDDYKKTQNVYEKLIKRILGGV